MYDDIIKANKGLLNKQLSKMYLVDDPDAISLGLEAMYNACRTYNPNKAAKFSTYATVCIYNALGSYIRTKNKQRQIDVVSYHAMLNEEQDFECVLASTECVEDTCLRAELKQKVNEAIASLTIELAGTKYIDIFNVWRDNDFEISTVEVARKVGVSQSYASQTINILKFKLKQKLEDYYNG